MKRSPAIARTANGSIARRIMAVAAIGAAAYRPGEPIASGDPKLADEIVRMAAAINDTAAAPRPWLWLPLALGAAKGAIIASLILGLM
jgi:hypothetical protein